MTLKGNQMRESQVIRFKVETHLKKQIQNSQHSQQYFSINFHMKLSYIEAVQSRPRLFTVPGSRSLQPQAKKYFMALLFEILLNLGMEPEQRSTYSSPSYSLSIGI